MNNFNFKSFIHNNMGRYAATYSSSDTDSDESYESNDTNDTNGTNGTNGTDDMDETRYGNKSNTFINREIDFTNYNFNKQFNKQFEQYTNNSSLDNDKIEHLGNKILVKVVEDERKKNDFSTAGGSGTGGAGGSGVGGGLPPSLDAMQNGSAAGGVSAADGSVDVFDLRNNFNTGTAVYSQKNMEKGQPKIDVDGYTENIQYKQTQLLVIDSRDRDNSNDNTNNYTYTLLRPIKHKIYEIELLESYIRDTSYNINTYNNYLRININIFDKNRPSDLIENIIIPPGNYYQDSDNNAINLDDKLNNILGLYNKFANINIKFNYNSEKYYIYQSYSNIVKHQSDIYNIFLNFGEIKYMNRSQGDLETTWKKTNRLFPDIKPLPINTPLKIKTYSNKTIGKYMGFKPEYCSSFIKNIVTVKYSKNSDNENILRFSFNNNSNEANELFNKLYELFIWSQEDMFIGFKLDPSWKSMATIRSGTTYLILKIFPKFATNIITHSSNDSLNADSDLPFIQLTLVQPLHEWPEYNVLKPAEMFDTTGSIGTEFIKDDLSNIIHISDEIIMPIISDYPYELNNDKYMLMNVICNNKPLNELHSNNEVIDDAFCQFRTDSNRDYFRVLGMSHIKRFPQHLSHLNQIKIKFKDRNNNDYDLNNKHHSFTFKITYIDPQLTSAFVND